MCTHHSRNNARHSVARSRGSEREREREMSKEAYKEAKKAWLDDKSNDELKQKYKEAKRAWKGKRKRESKEEDEPTSAESKDPPKSSKYVSHTLFVGQLPYDCTKQDICNHFKDGGVTGDVKVRMLTDRKTKKFRGIAFVEFSSSRQMALGLRLHQSHFGEFSVVDDGKKRPNRWGRIINVERTCGGGGKGAARKEKLDKLRDIQGQQVMKDVLKEVESAIELSKGNIYREDFDQKVLNALCTVPRNVATEILSEFSRGVTDKVRNRPAWLMGILQKYRTQLTSGETIELSVKPFEKTGRRGGSGRGRGGGGRGRGRGRGGRGRGRGRGGKRPRHG